MGEPILDESASAGLSTQDLAILEFERQWWRHPGSKEGAIRELFSMSSPRYYQALNALLDRPEAEIAYPTLVRRLRRLRDSRTTGNPSV